MYRQLEPPSLIATTPIGPGWIHNRNYQQTTSNLLYSLRAVKAPVTDTTIGNSRALTCFYVLKIKIKNKLLSLMEFEKIVDFLTRKIRFRSLATK
jgi:hypothetical protein